MSYLILANGRAFEGERFGAAGDARGEIVFHTNMVGYQEMLADARNDGLMVVATFPLIGNYGIIPEDMAGVTPRLSALIVRELCEEPSNFRCEGTLNEYMKAHGIPGLCGIDTRVLARVLRGAGSMNAAVVDVLPDDLNAFCSELTGWSPKNDLAAVSVSDFATVGEGERLVAVWDFGAPGDCIHALRERGCAVLRVPAGASAEAILARKPAGVVLSGGPGDPAQYKEIIAEIGKLAQANLPILGIGLGHQLLAIARGGRTEKMKIGHRGVNQTVKDVTTGRYFITSQNHGNAVSCDALPDGADLWLVNANDSTVEGLTYRDIDARSVQFIPDDLPGPDNLYDAFVSKIGGTGICR